MNVVKHAKAKHARVSLEEDGRRDRDPVEDDGVGFDASEIARSSGKTE